MNSCAPFLHLSSGKAPMPWSFQYEYAKAALYDIIVLLYILFLKKKGVINGTQCKLHTNKFPYLYLMGRWLSYIDNVFQVNNQVWEEYHKKYWFIMGPKVTMIT